MRGGFGGPDGQFTKGPPRSQQTNLVRAFCYEACCLCINRAVPAFSWACLLRQPVYSIIEQELSLHSMLGDSSPRPFGVTELNVFISWSGRDSKAVGSALKEFFPRVLSSIQPWMSDEDIPPGGLWKSTLHHQLSKAEFAIVCVTRTNTAAPWLLYELGCLAMQVPPGQVIPLLFGIESKDVPDPLNSFQALSANREGLGKLMQAMNDATDGALHPTVLKERFEEAWPTLEASLAGHLVITDESGIQVVSIRLLRLLDEHDVAMIRRGLQRTIASGQHWLVIDLENVEHLSSAAMAAFLLNTRTAASNGGSMVFANACDSIQQFLSTTQMDKVLDLFESTEEAVEALRLRATAG